ncbi:MAG TPA: 6-phosphogluconolactonase [Solirubrobacteraceae bacterium]|nr:6-phosphogluconolactonase [Solirubrobacteraceae bacterium]
MTRLTTCVDPEAVAERAAADIARYCRRVSAERELAHVALSGGSTPKRTYELLGARPAELAGVELWFADERCVPPDDEESNYRLVSESLLVPARVSPERVHRMQGELGPDQGARGYEQALREGIRPWEKELPVLDLIVLGVGPDGHVASLFPGSPTLDAGDAAVCLGVGDSPKPPPERITLSLAVLRAARRCLLLATGTSKADAIAAMLGEPSRHVPASLLRRERLTVIVDDAAAPPGRRP